MRAVDVAFLGAIARRRAVAPLLLAPDDPDHSYDARLLTPQLSGTLLLSWPDAGSGGLDLDVTPAPTSGGTYRSDGGPNGEPCYEQSNFQVGPKYIYGVFPSQLTVATMTIAALFRRTAASSNMYITGGTSSARRHDIFNTTSNRLAFHRGTQVNSVGTQVASTWGYVVVYFDGAASTINVNGVQSGGNVGPHSIMQGIVVGNTYAIAAGNSWLGQISGVHYWLNRDVRTNAEAYCRARLGLP